MRIGIDARLLSQPVTGIGRYTAEMVRAFALGGYDDQYYLYVPTQPLESVDAHPNLIVRAGSVSTRVARMVWSQSSMPWQASRDGVQLFWGTSHRLPRYLPRNMARVVTIHDLVWMHASQTMRTTSRLLERCFMPQALRAADRVIAVSQSTAADLAHAFPEVADKIRVVPLGVTGLVAPLPRGELVALGVDRPYFLFVGTLEPRKNIGRLLSAYAQVPASARAGCCFVVAGGRGWGGIDIQSMAQGLGLASEVVITGYVSDKQLSTLYAHARFLAMPSLYEGFGLPIVEAMSCGVPVLTSNTSSLPEVAGPGGLLVDPLDEVSIATGLQRMLLDDALIEALSARARIQAARFNWVNAANATRAVFVEALQARISRNGEGAKHTGAGAF